MYEVRSTLGIREAGEDPNDVWGRLGPGCFFFLPFS